MAHKTVLHVGCGPASAELLHPAFRGPEWREVRLDVNVDVEPDIVGTITEMGEVGSASVDAVWSSHNLEHLYAHEVPVALREFARVLRPGGAVLITLPDLQAVAEVVAAGNLESAVYESAAGPIAPLDILYGHRPALAGGNDFMAHRTGFTCHTLGSHLQAAGFEEVNVRRERFALWASARKPA